MSPDCSRLSESICITSAAIGRLVAIQSGGEKRLWCVVVVCDCGSFSVIHVVMQPSCPGVRQQRTPEGTVGPVPGRVEAFVHAVVSFASLLPTFWKGLNEMINERKAGPVIAAVAMIFRLLAYYSWRRRLLPSTSRVSCA